MEVNTLAIEGGFLDEFDLFKTFERPEESCLVMLVVGRGRLEILKTLILLILIHERPFGIVFIPH